MTNNLSNANEDQTMAPKYGPSFGSTSSSTPESVKQGADNLANDLIEILKKNAGDGEGTIYGGDIKSLLIDLSIFITNRDYRILQHGIDMGRAEKWATH